MVIVFAQARWLERYPHATASITHGFPWRTFLDDASTGLEALPSEVFAPFETGRCFLEVSFPVRLGDVFEYPYKEHAQRSFSSACCRCPSLAWHVLDALPRAFDTESLSPEASWPGT